jgi:precorrin-8X/cobalt-precorrin-8 methylmutase
MSLFDEYLFVDWSAANGAQSPQPRADAVWIGELVPGVRQLETYHRTRESGVSHVARVLQDGVADQRRVLVGFDFPYGYPDGFSIALDLPSGRHSWWMVWAELAHRVRDTSNNENNRFTAAGELNAIIGNGQGGPFWGAPVRTAVANLGRLSPGFPFRCPRGEQLSRLRTVDARLPGTQEAWKLFGAGSVGSQALTGIPYVYSLRRSVVLARVSRVWPFETGFTSTPCPSEGPFVLHAEIWPGVVEDRVQMLTAADRTLIRDRVQVRAMCEWAAECDAANQLGKYFNMPANLHPQQVQACLENEGWVLGAL